jgi:hypothetical protein
VEQAVGITFSLCLQSYRQIVAQMMRAHLRIRDRKVGVRQFGRIIHCCRQAPSQAPRSGLQAYLHQPFFSAGEGAGDVPRQPCTNISLETCIAWRTIKDMHACSACSSIASSRSLRHLTTPKIYGVRTVERMWLNRDR